VGQGSALGFLKIQLWLPNIRLRFSLNLFARSTELFGLPYILLLFVLFHVRTRPVIHEPIPAEQSDGFGLLLLILFRRWPLGWYVPVKLSGRPVG
jgi:hypothetical protein